MIQKAQDDEPLSPSSAAASFRAFTSAQDALAIHRFIVGAAAHGDGVEDDPKLRKGYVEIAARFLWSPLKAQTPSAGVDLGDLQTIEGCLTAVQAIAQAQADGTVTIEGAESLARTVDRAMQAHRTTAGERALEALEDAGAYMLPLGADMTEEEAGRFASTVINRMNAEHNRWRSGRTSTGTGPWRAAPGPGAARRARNE